MYVKIGLLKVCDAAPLALNAETSEALPGVWGTGAIGHLFQGNRGTKAKFFEGNMGNKDNIGDQGT